MKRNEKHVWSNFDERTYLEMLSMDWTACGSSCENRFPVVMVHKALTTAKLNRLVKLTGVPALALLNKQVNSVYHSSIYNDKVEKMNTITPNWISVPWFRPGPTLRCWTCRSRNRAACAVQSDGCLASSFLRWKWLLVNTTRDDNVSAN